MIQESNGETKKVDWLDILQERNPVLSEPGLDHYLVEYLLLMRKESEWIGRNEQDINLMTGAVLSFAEHLKEAFYHVGRH